MLIEEVNGFNAEIFQRLFANATDVFRAAVELPFDPFFVFVKNKAEFVGDLNTILKGRNCFAHKFFVFSADASIDLGGVKKIDAKVISVSDKGLEHGFVRRFATVVAHTHATQTQCGDSHGSLTGAERASLHDVGNVDDAGSLIGSCLSGRDKRRSGKCAETAQQVAACRYGCHEELLATMKSMDCKKYPLS